MANKIVKHLGASWFVWLFPALAVLLSGGLLFETLKNRGPEITIEAPDAEGVQPEKTKLHYHGVTIGSVTEVNLDEDGHIEIKIRLDRQSASFARAGTRFVLIKPKASFQGVTGLNTILEGLYIEAYPAAEPGAKTTRFKAGDAPIEMRENMSEYELEAENSESISPGDAITYRGVRVGGILAKNLTKAGTMVRIRIAIENAQTYLIRDNTKFWRKVGVEANIGLLGAKIKMNSFESIVNGGLEIAIPSPAAARAKAGFRFHLDSAPPKDFEKWAPELR